jgi:tight adherence protein B
MRMIVLLLSIAVALSIFVMARSGRANLLQRLDILVATKSGSSTAGRQEDLAEKLLSESFMRKFLLLGLAPRTLVIVAGSAVAATLFMCKWQGIAVGAAFALAVLAGGMIVVQVLIQRHIRQLGEMMPNFFDRVRQLLAVGNSLPTAFTRAVSSAQPALATFFAPAIRRVGNGAGFSETITATAQDMDLYEMHLFAAAISANMRFGGSLTHVLGNLVGFLRKRAAVERELRANTAQIRFSAWVLGLLPIFVASLIVMQNRAYAQWFLTDPLGHRFLIYCILSQIAGAFVMRAITRTQF